MGVIETPGRVNPPIQVGGLITPPVGTVLNTVAGVGRMKMDDVTRGMLPFMWAEFAMMFLMVLFPQLVIVPARWFIN